ncbi:MAG: histidine kinase dimerization/phospho-acceptor domain-containing protein [Vicinamibacterales bacterium]
MDLLLHELRTPISVAQGYLRLLVEDRLSDPRDRERALAQSLEALGRIGNLCGSADEYLNVRSTVELVRYPASELVATLQSTCQGDAFAVNVPNPHILGDVRSLSVEQTAIAIAGVLRAALRSDPVLTQAVHVGVHGTDLILTTGDEAVRERLVAPTGRAAFNQWRGGTGLQVPLALKLLAHTPLRIWALSENSGAIAIAMPLELPA